MKIEQLYQLYIEAEGVTTDTRNIQPGTLYFALKGERFDGNEFALDAIEKGAVAAVVDNPAYHKEGVTILVENVLKSLQELSTFHREQFKIPVIAITGSNGKTTTKELIHHVLSKQFNTLSTLGNFNNHIGVPLTLLRLNKEHQIAVIEMGANHQKEIAQLCSIAKPDYGLITSIGKAHLEGFGGLEGVRKGKGEMYDYLKNSNGTIFLNKDLSALNEMAEERALEDYISYGSSGRNQYNFKFLGANPLVKLSYKEVQVQGALPGAYNYHNYITAFTIGLHFKVELNAIVSTLETYQSSNQRSEMRLWKGHNVIVDAYNANPTSMSAALTHFAGAKAATKVVILGDMLELGEYAGQEHEQIAKELAAIQPDYACLVGPHFMQVDTDNQTFTKVDNVAEAANWLQSLPIKNALILLKGSRGIAIEQVLEQG